MKTNDNASTEAPVLVTGGTGGIGAHLVRMLARENARPRVISRDRARAERLLGGEVDIVEGDLAKPETLGPALAGCERAFFLGVGGPKMGAEATAFAALARKAGVRHVVVISSGTIDMSPPVALGQWHLAIEDAFTASGLATTFLRPDNFATNSLGWAGMIRERGVVFSSAPESQSVPIDPFDIAAVACVALTKPGHEGKVYTLSGPTVMSVREQVASIGKVIDRPLDVVEVPRDKARMGMIGSGMPPVIADAVLDLMNHPPRHTTTVRDVTGREPRAFATWVQENRAAFASR